VFDPSLRGRATPSSPTNHSPSIRIDAREPLARNVVNKAAVVVGMCGPGEPHRLLRRVGDEDLLTSRRSIHFTGDPQSPRRGLPSTAQEPRFIRLPS